MALASWHLLVALATLCGAAAVRRHQVADSSSSEAAKSEVEWFHETVHTWTDKWRNRLDKADRGAAKVEEVPKIAREKTRQVGELKNQLGAVVYQSDLFKEGRQAADYGMVKKGQYKDLKKDVGQQVANSDFVAGGTQQGSIGQVAASAETEDGAVAEARGKVSPLGNWRLRQLAQGEQRGLKKWKHQKQHRQLSQKNQQTQQVELPEQEPSGEAGIEWAKKINEQHAQNP